MSNQQVAPAADALGPRYSLRQRVTIFALATVALSVVLILALPGVVGPVVVVFVPALVAAALVATEGKGALRDWLFRSGMWRIRWQWAAISLGLAVAVRLGVNLVGGNPAPLPGLPQLAAVAALLPMMLLFAAGEELGWRGFALPRLMERYPALTAALLLGLPWAALHLPLLLPGRMGAGAPVVANIVTLLALAVLLAWIFLASGRSLLAATLFHGGQNALTVLHGGMDLDTINWAMAAVYGGAALLVVLLTRGRLGRRRGDDE